MTPFKLQDDLIDELKYIFSGSKLQIPRIGINKEKIYSEPNIYGQSLPIRDHDDQEDDPFPYLIVRIESGEMKGDTPHLVMIRILIGIFDDNNDTNGHKDVLNIIQKVYERFTKNPSLNGKYVMKNDRECPFTWVLQDGDTHPYYFGAIDTTWETRSFRRESPYT